MPAAHVPTDETRSIVSSAVSFGIPQEHIARKLGITAETLRAHYRTEIDCGTQDLIFDAASTLRTLAIEEKDRASLMFLLKTRGKWAERVTVVNEIDDERTLDAVGIALTELKLSESSIESGKLAPEDIRWVADRIESLLVQA